MKSVFQRQSTGPLQLNMTSMIDVIFLLLIFFVLTANFDRIEKLLPTNLFLRGNARIDPKIPNEETILGEIQIRIVAENGKILWKVNQRTCSTFTEFEKVLGELESISPSIPVIIDPFRSLPIEKVIDVYDACRRTGLTKIQFAAEEKAAGGTP